MKAKEKKKKKKGKKEKSMNIKTIPTTKRSGRIEIQIRW